MDIKYDNKIIDTIDLKALLVSRGVKVSNRIYKKYKGQVRLSPNPLECNTIILPDDTIVQLTDLAFHMDYIKSAISWDTLKQLKYFSQIKTDFRLDLDDSDNPAIFLKKQKLVNITFPKPTDFYKQKTTNGIPYIGNAVLQGTQWLSFQLLWKCDYACAGEPCQYCYSGGELDSLTKRKKKLPIYPTPDDIAEIVEYAVIKEKYVDSLQITGGSTFNVQAECDKIKAILDAINKRVGRENIKGEILIYTTPPINPHMIDQLFEAGADRISMSLEIWDEELAKKIMPGKIKFTGRQRHLDALEYVVNKYGKGKACSNFIIGLEPTVSILEGADYIASKGIVPIASVWVPFGRPVLGSMKAPDLEYYQKIKNGLADIYSKYGLVPPGAKGLNVCMCRDIYQQISKCADYQNNKTTTEMTKIKILGANCFNCNMLEKNTRIAAYDLNLEAEIEKIGEIDKILSYSVLRTPALIINEKVIFCGEVPNVSEIKNILKAYTKNSL